MFRAPQRLSFWRIPIYTLSLLKGLLEQLKFLCNIYLGGRKNRYKKKESKQKGTERDRREEIPGSMPLFQSSTNNEKRRRDSSVDFRSSKYVLFTSRNLV